MPAIDLDKIKIRRMKDTDNFQNFHCDIEDDNGCNDFIHRENEAKQYQKERHGITYLAFYEETMIAYITLAMSSISAERLEKKDKEPIKLNFYPCLLIGRLAVSNEFRHSDIGTQLSEWATGVAYLNSEKIGCRYVILETKESKVRFYSQCGFHRGSVLEGDRHVWMYKKIVI